MKINIYSIRQISTVLLIVIMLTHCAKPKDSSPGEVVPEGSVGTNSTPVVAIKFCPNAVANYPISFPEYGFCISGHLYATFWDGNTAYTTEVIPGNYFSPATNASCTFSVQDNCVVISRAPPS